MKILKKWKVESFLAGDIVIKNTNRGLLSVLLDTLLIRYKKEELLKDRFFSSKEGKLISQNIPGDQQVIVDIEECFEEELVMFKDSEMYIVTASDGEYSSRVELIIDYKKKTFTISSEHEEGVSFAKDSVETAKLKLKCVSTAISHMEGLKASGQF